jgi:general secretion pathway protein D
LSQSQSHVGGSANEVAAIGDLIRTFDVDWLSGMSFAIVRPQFADARSLRSELAAIAGTSSAVRLISSPSMMVMNNRTASLLVGDQVPIATQQSVGTTTTGAPVINSIEYRDTGVILKVTPHVNEAGQVRMDIDQEVSDVTKTTSSDISSPTIEQRKFTSSLSVRNGETIVLGGIIKDQREHDNSGVPILKDVPLLGNLFKTIDDSITRRELIVLITPHVARSDDELRRVTQDLRDRLSSPPSVPDAPKPAKP